MAEGAGMIKVISTGLVALTLAGCGAQGQPVAPGATPAGAETAETETGATANVGLGIGPNGINPGVTLADGIGRVTLGPGGVRLGAAGIPLSLGL